MRSMCVVLTATGGPEEQDPIEFMGTFQDIFAAVEWIWNHIGPSFTGWDQYKGNASDVPFLRNAAIIFLKPEPCPLGSGLGALKYFRAWIKQHDKTGDLPWTIAVYQAADVKTVDNRGSKTRGDLRWNDGYVHVTNPLGQEVEEETFE